MNNENDIALDPTFIYSTIYIYIYLRQQEPGKNQEMQKNPVVWGKTRFLMIWKYEKFEVLAILIRSIFQWFSMRFDLFMCPPAAPRRPNWFMLAPSGSQFFLIHKPGSQVRLEWLNRIRTNHLMYPAFLKWLCAASRDRCNVRFTASRHETRRLIRDGFPMKSSNSCVDHTKGFMQNPASLTWSTIKKNISCSLWRLGMKGNNALPSW